MISTEKKLQEQLHIDQAVEDIVRIIKQDHRASLLIVQLLRRYQLEKADYFEAKPIPVYSNQSQQTIENKHEFLDENAKFQKIDQKINNNSGNCCSTYECENYNNTKINSTDSCRCKTNFFKCCAVKTNFETPLVVIDDSNDEISNSITCSQEEIIQNSLKTIFKSAKDGKKINNKPQNRLTL